MRAQIRKGIGDLWGLMPRGTPLADEDWAKRHRTIAIIALLHVPAVFIYALVTGVGLTHALVETLPVLVCALLGRRPGARRMVREVFTTLSLVTSSAVLVHLSGGYIELHFHFFVVVALVTLYQQWTPFLLAIGFVALHHGIAGALEPTSVYNHPAALAQPWRWAGIHAAFISMASAVGLANWKLNELARHRAEEYFRRLYEGEQAVVQRLEETDQVKSELVAAVSHEFRTPLTAILGYAQGMQRSASIPQHQVGQYASRIYWQARRLQQLVDNLLEAENPLAASEGSCDAETVIATTVRTTVTDTHPDLAIDVDVTPELQLHLGSEAAQLVLANLVGNALKFATPGTPITVRASRSGDGDGATIEVANHGPAVPSHLRDRIFEPFVQGDSSNTRLADGVGLGLHIVRRVVTANSGQITVTCRDGVTTFAVWIPAASDATADHVGEFATLGS